MIGGAGEGKAIIILNPADRRRSSCATPSTAVPRDDEIDEKAIFQSVEKMVAEVQAYVPGYRLKSPPVTDKRQTPWGSRTVIVILLEVEGAGDYLPPYAGNLDIMTAAAYRIGELFARRHSRTAKEHAHESTSDLVDYRPSRDGSHAMRHQFTRDQVRQIVTALDAAGVPVIEVSHGDGLAGSSLQYGFSGTPEMDLIEEARSAARNAKIAALLLPGRRDAQRS